MATQFNFELVSPEEKLISEPAFQVTIPGQEGELGVRAGHMSLVVAIRPGVVTVQREENGVMEKVFIAGGFADISQSNVTVLAEEAFPISALNADKLEAELRDLDGDMKMAEDEIQKAKIEAKRVLVSTMLMAIVAA